MEGKIIVDTEGNRLPGINLTKATVIEDGNFAIGVAYDDESADCAAKVINLKRELASTDYKALKYAEGAISDEDYAAVKAKRQVLRDQINELQAMIKIPTLTREEMDAIEVKALKKLGVQTVTVENGFVKD